MSTAAILRFQRYMTVQTANGPKEVLRKGKTTGEVSSAGMIRVEWEEDGYGKMGWLSPDDYIILL